MEKTSVISVNGMSCEHCVKAVDGALQLVSGVKEISVSLSDKNVRVIYDDQSATLADLENAITEEGYDVVK